MKNGALLAIAYLSFAVHAIPTGMLGVAWPDIRTTFGVSLDALGAVLSLVTLGYFLASLSNGRLLRAFGIGSLLLLSWISVTLGITGYAFTTSWWLLLASAFLVGLGGGTLVTGLNTYIATNFSHRHMNWMHAHYGLGAALGPLALAYLSAKGVAWQQNYGLLALLQGCMAGIMLLTLRSWRLNLSPGGAEETREQVSNGRTLRLPIVWLSLLLFFLYVGAETTAGQWSYTLFTQARGISPLQASTWISIFWVSLTIGRLLVGFAVGKITADRLLQASMGGVLTGALLLSLPTAATSFLGLTLMGFACAAIFPLLVSGTPQRVGIRHTANAMGLQNASASMGLAILPGTAGLLAENANLELIGPFIVLLAALLWGAFQWLSHMMAAEKMSHLAGAYKK